MQLTLQELENYNVVEENLLTQTESYRHYKQRAKKLYDELYNNNPGMEYRPYQYEYASLYANRKFNICGGSPGIGKTYIAGLTIASIYLHDLTNLRPGSIHIVVPTRLVASSRWLVDLNNIPLLRGQIELLTKEQQVLTSNKPIWVYHQDFIKRKAKTLQNTRNFISRLMVKKSRHPQFLIYDEIHHLQAGSQRNREYFYLRRKCKRVLGLSGTLSDGRLEMINTICTFVYGWRWGYTKNSFIAEFGTKTQLKTNYLTGEESNELTSAPRYLSHLAINKVPKYYNLIRSFVHRISMNDPNVLSVVKLPDKNLQVLNIPMSELHQRHYLSVVNNHINNLRLVSTYGNSSTGRSRAFSLLKPLLDAASFPEIDEPSAKLIKCVELINEAASRGEKTVIFTKHIRTSRLLTAKLTETFGSSKVIRMYANDLEADPKTLSMVAREDVHSEFMFNNDVLAGVFSIQLSGEGIDLTNATNVIFYELPFQAIQVSQAICRVRRPGSVADVINLYYLNHVGTIDQHIYKLLEEKLKKSSLLLDFEVEDVASSIETGNVNPIDVINALLEEI
jgi:superfamily II DNA or RNA helicase